MRWRPCPMMTVKAAQSGSQRIFQLGVRAVCARAGCAHAMRLQFPNLLQAPPAFSPARRAQASFFILRIGINALG